jgi:hypothetical protein
MGKDDQHGRLTHYTKINFNKFLMGEIENEFNENSPRDSLLKELQRLGEEREKLIRLFYDVAPRNSQARISEIRENDINSFNIDRLATLDNKLLLQQIMVLKEVCRTLRDVYQGILDQRASY